MGEVIDLNESRRKVTDAVRATQLAKIAIGEFNFVQTQISAEQEDVLPDVIDRQPRPFTTETPQPEGDNN